MDVSRMVMDEEASGVLPLLSEKRLKRKDTVGFCELIERGNERRNRSLNCLWSRSQLEPEEKSALLTLRLRWPRKVESSAWCEV